MKFADLLQYLDQNTPYELLDGSSAETWQKAHEGTHHNPVAAEIIQAVADNAGISSIDDELERVAFVNALAKVRLKYMADDAPVDGFRTVEAVIATADAAYNQEALETRNK